MIQCNHLCCMEKIHIGNEIKKALESSHLSVSAFAEKINKTRVNVYSIFKRESIDTDLLLKICEVLGVDLFKLYSSDYQRLAAAMEDLKKENFLFDKINRALVEKYEVPKKK